MNKLCTLLISIKYNNFYGEEYNAKQLLRTRGKKVIERLIEYYVEIDEYKEDLDKQQKSIQNVVKQFMKEKDKLESYRTQYVEVKMKSKNNKLTVLEITELIKEALKNDLKETLIPIWNKKSRKYLAIKKKDFEIYRQYNLEDYKNNRFMQNIRDILIKKNKLEFLTFDKKALVDVRDMMLYNNEQIEFASRALNKLESNVLVFRRLR